MHSRIALTALFLLTLSSARAQLVNVTIETDPAGGLFQVDGQPYNSTTTFAWEAGSAHELSVTSPQQLRSDSSGALYQFVRWVDSTGLLNSGALTVRVIASPSLTWVRAQFARNQYPLRIQFFECLQAGCQPPGSVTVNNVVYTADATIYLAEGAEVEIRATAFSGYVFQGWGSGQPVNNNAPVQKFVMRGPVVLMPRFAPATPVDLEVFPPGLLVLADGVAHKAPIRLYWAEGSTHALSALSPQTDQSGRDWVFARWEHGGELRQDVKAGPANLPMRFRAEFAPGARVGFLTKPTGLRLIIDGSDRWPGYNFIWAVGSVHRVSAPLTQTDSAGRPYVFQGWEHGGEATQNLIVPPEAEQQGLRWIAVYEPLSRLTIRATLEGAPILVDGKMCETPCVVDRPQGAEVVVAAGDFPPPGADTRVEFAGWADGQPRERRWRASQDLPVWVAVYRRLHRLRVSVSPPQAGAIHVTPGSPDDFYPENEPLLIQATANNGYRFQQWRGAVAHRLMPADLTLTGPAQLEAVFERSGPRSLAVSVWNVVGPTPHEEVAPGAIVSIYGDEIAPELVVAPPPPLPQSLAGISVRVSGQLLGLLFVSAGQINAVLPGTLSEGEHRVEVLRTGAATLAGEFRVRRNSPGLFTWRQGERVFGVALHADGKLVTPENPGKRGEWLTLVATGLGPLRDPWPDGFPAPQEPPLPLLDRVDAFTGEIPLSVKDAAAMPGQVGLQRVLVQVPEAISGDSVLLLRLAVKDRRSNEIRIPVKGE